MSAEISCPMIGTRSALPQEVTRGKAANLDAIHLLGPHRDLRQGQFLKRQGQQADRERHGGNRRARPIKTDASRLEGVQLRARVGEEQEGTVDTSTIRGRALVELPRQEVRGSFERCRPTAA